MVAKEGVNGLSDPFPGSSSSVVCTPFYCACEDYHPSFRLNESEIEAEHVSFLGEHVLYP